MPLRFEFESFGDRLVSRELIDIGHRGLDARPAFRVIADDLMKGERRRFNSRGNGTWAALSPSTVQEKARRRLDPRILHATGALRESLTVKGAPGQELIIEPQFLVLGTSLPYAKFHQRGTSRMPARKPLGFTVAQRRNAVKTLQRFVRTGEA